jgi:hypothetical protein
VARRSQDYVSTPSSSVACCGQQHLLLLLQQGSELFLYFTQISRIL